MSRSVLARTAFSFATASRCGVHCSSHGCKLTLLGGERPPAPLSVRVRPRLYQRGRAVSEPTQGAYIHPMPSKPIELPPALARAFVEDMRLFFAEENPIKRDELAARQLRALREYSPPRAKKLRLSVVHEMFLTMRDQV
jgi:hypothetical protein